FANNNANAARTWVTTSRGSVGGNGTYATGSPAADHWPWAPPPTGRWEQPITSPAGTAIYPALPGDGPQAADIFTNPPQVCNATPPCIQWNTAQQQTCVQTQQVQVGTTQQCTAYVDVPVFGDVCVQYQQVQTGWTNGACNTFQTQTTYVNGACNTWQTVPDYATQCQMVTIADPTS